MDGRFPGKECGILFRAYLHGDVADGDAEKAFRKTADSGDANLAALGKLALAGLYRQNKRDTEAIDLYKQLIAKPTATVPAATAQLELAGYVRNHAARRSEEDLRGTEG